MSKLRSNYNESSAAKDPYENKEIAAAVNASLFNEPDEPGYYDTEGDIFHYVSYLKSAPILYE
jgi:hypothetical protein